MLCRRTDHLDLAMVFTVRDGVLDGLTRPLVPVGQTMAIVLAITDLRA